MQIALLIKQAAEQLSNISDSAKLDAEILLAHSLGKDRTYLFTWSDRELSVEQIAQFESLLARRITGEPIAYIIGSKDFWSLTLKVAPHTLIPRPDTETLVEWIIDLAEDNNLAKQNIKVLDLGTGTGAIALAIAKEFPNWQVTGVDLIAEAVNLANQNKVLNKISNVEFLQSSWFESLEKENQFTFIVSNPPYIDPEDLHLTQGDVRFEPSSALIADDHGLADIKHISQQAAQYLSKDSAILFEHGYDQADAVRKILAAQGLHEISTRVDLAGNDRITMAMSQDENNAKWLGLE